MKKKERTRQEARWQQWKAKGEQAFKDGKPASAIDEAGLYNLGARNAWLVGWRNAGGKL
jgi:hypothetical protein